MAAAVAAKAMNSLRFMRQVYHIPAETGTYRMRICVPRSAPNFSVRPPSTTHVSMIGWEKIVSSASPSVNARTRR